MTALTPAQEQRIRNVKTADTNWRRAKSDAHERARILAETEITAFAAQRDLTVRQAFEAGIPKAQIGKKGLGTSSPVTVNDSLARTSAMAETIAEADAHPMSKLIKWDATADAFTVTAPFGDSFQFRDGQMWTTTHQGPTGKSWDQVPDKLASDEFKVWYYANMPEIQAYMEEAK